MSDTTLNVFLGSGTTATRTALIPAPPTPAAGPDPGYTFWDTDLQQLFAWDAGAAAWVATGGGAGTITGPGTSTDNAIVRWNGTGGTALQNSAPTVEDDGTITTVTDPANLQDAATKNYVDTQIASVNVGGAAQNSFLVSGGQVVWTSGYDFDVSAATYYIQGVLYTSAEQSITLDAADPSNDRLDVIAVDDTGTVVKITGTASAAPSEPDIDLGSQLQLAIVLVSAGSIQPDTASTVLVYQDNAGSPTEWDWTTSGTGFDVNSTNNPRGGSTHDIEGTAVTAGSYAQGEIGSGSLTPFDYGLFVCYIQSKATWSAKRGLQVSFLNAGVLIGQAVAINRTGTFGFVSSDTAAYQQIAIPISNFAVAPTDTITQVRFTDFGGSIGFYLDDISFQTSGNSGTIVQGITQDQADARYLQRSNNLSDVASVATATAALNAMVGDSGAGGTKGMVPAPAAGDAAASKFLKADATWSVPAGSGDVVGPGTSVDDELVLFNSTSGKLIKSATLTGIVKATSGVSSAATKGSDYVAPVEYDAGNSGASLTLDWNNGNQQRVTLTASCTLTLSNPVAGMIYRVILLEDGTGTWTPTFPATVKWENGTPPTWVTTANNVIFVTLVYTGLGGAGYLGFGTVNPIASP